MTITVTRNQAFAGGAVMLVLLSAFGAFVFPTGPTNIHQMTQSESHEEVTLTRGDNAVTVYPDDHIVCPHETGSPKSDIDYCTSDEELTHEVLSEVGFYNDHEHDH